MTSTPNKLADGTIQLTITLSQDQVEKAWDEVVEDIVKNTQLKGFRRGKAPKKLIEQSIDKEKVKEEVLKKLLPAAYMEAVNEHQLRPIINPQIHVDPDQIGVEKLEDGKDWQFTATTCEKPEVELNSYQENVKKITAKSKIILPGKEPEKPKLEQIVQALLSSVKLTIPKILLDHEVDRLLAQLLDEVGRLGLTLDQYLTSTGKTPQTLREEYTKKAIDDLGLEFALEKIADSEHIVVEEKEVEDAIGKAKTEEEKKNLGTNRYLLASILRRQKTLDFLTRL